MDLRARDAATGSGGASPTPHTPLAPEDLRKIDAYWRAANYLSVGQIYLYDNPLLREPLTLAHIKPLVVGHWGTTPGQNFIYVHLNRAMQRAQLRPWMLQQTPIDRLSLRKMSSAVKIDGGVQLSVVGVGRSSARARHQAGVRPARAVRGSAPSAPPRSKV